MAEEAPGIEYAGVRVEAAAIHRMRGDRSVRCIPRAEIAGLRLLEGRVPSPLRILGAVLGFALGAIGALGLATGGSPMLPEESEWALLCLPLGAWSLRECLARRRYLQVQTAGRVVAIEFQGRPSRESLDAFRDQVRRAFGVEIPAPDFTGEGPSPDRT